MTAIKGTTDDDYLIGTDGDDRFTPQTGYDVVLGGAGFDTLALNYGTMSGSNSSSYASSIFANGTSLGGVIWSSDGSNLVSFADIERVTGTLDSGDNLLYVYGYGAAPDAFNLDGGGGNDRLSIGAEFWGNFDFIVGPNGKAHGTLGNFSNFESYEISLGVGSHHVTTGAGNDAIYDYTGSAVINSGAGDDLISSYHSIDQVDGGSGFDTWSGNYDEDTSGLSFTSNGTDGSLSNGTAVHNLESISLTTGSGDDQFTITGANQMYVNAGDGTDTLNADFSNSISDADYVGFGTTRGTGMISGGTATVSFDGFEHVSYLAGSGNTSAELNLVGMAPGNSLLVDGGQGSDDVLFAWQTFQPINMMVAADGTLTSDVGVTLKNFETMTIYLGGGSDTIESGAGDDVIFGRGGSDRIDGSAGADIVSGGSGADTFVFEQLGDLDANGNDAIIDFSSAQGDKIDVSGLSDQAFTFIGDSAFTGDGPELRYDLSNGQYVVHGDLNGDGVGDFQFVVTASSLSGSDFISG